MLKLVRLVYISEATRPFTPEELATLLRRSQENNAARGLSGLLLHAGGNFIQVLEGTAEAVTERYDVIAADVRHRRVSRILCEVTTTRLFGRWTMGSIHADAISRLDRVQLRQVVRSADGPTGAVDRTQVHTLLQNFSRQMSASAQAA